MKGWDAGHAVPCTWQLSYLAIERPLSALGGPFLSFFAQMGIEITSPLVGAPFCGTVHISVMMNVYGTHTIETLPMSWCSQNHEAAQNE